MGSFLIPPKSSLTHKNRRADIKEWQSASSTCREYIGMFN